MSAFVGIETACGVRSVGVASDAEYLTVRLGAPGESGGHSLPFTSADFFEARGHQTWQSLARESGRCVFAGFVQLDTRGIEYGAWLADLDVADAAALARIVRQPMRIRWTTETVTVRPDASRNPPLTFGWTAELGLRSSDSRPILDRVA